MLHYLAPAKLNLFLHIIGRRPDGYHLLQTAMQFIDLCDELQFSLRQDSQIILTNPIAGVNSQDNLCYKAAKLLQDQFDIIQGIEIKLHKKIPMGSGMGGGSSDAATTLVALNQLWNLRLTTQSLCDLGLKLGTDVPFFVNGKAAWAEGIGEQLYPFAPTECWYLIIVPPVSVPTYKIYTHPELTRDTVAVKKSVTTLPMNHHNDCQFVVCKEYPEVRAVYNWLSHYNTAHMTGSGCAMFITLKDRNQGITILKQLPDSNWQTFICKGINMSALYTGK